MGAIIKSLVIFALAATVLASEKSYKNYSVIRTQGLTADQVSTLRNLIQSDKYDFWREPRVGKVADIMVAPHEALLLKDFLTRKQIQHHTIIKDVQDLIEKTRPAKKAKSGKNISLSEYNTYDEMTSYVADLPNKYPFVEVSSIGKSYEGRDTNIVHIKKAGPSKPTVWIEAGVHAREWISPAVALYIIDQLVEGSDFANDYNFYILPSVNPDGYEYSRTSDRAWRKSRSETGSALGCKGSDINRNFGFHFGESGVSSNKCSDIYPGPEAFSEVETRNLRDYITSLDETPIFAACLHSFSQLWLYPYGYAYDTFPENVEEQRKAGEKAVDAIFRTHGKIYENINSADLYPASGAADDYYSGVVKVPFTVTLELRDTGYYGFMLPEDQIIPTAEEAWAGLQAALKEISASKGVH